MHPRGLREEIRREQRTSTRENVGASRVMARRCRSYGKLPVMGLLTSIWFGACVSSADDPSWDELEAGRQALCAEVPPPPKHLPVLGPGLNAYYLQEEATRDLRRALGRNEQVTTRVSPVLNEVYDKVKGMGARWIRTNGFNDAQDRIGDSAIQTAPGTYDEIAFRGLDLVLARAAEENLSVVLSVTNYWDAYGGARQYVAWSGLDRPLQGDPRFFLEREPRALFAQYLRDLLHRKNHWDGIRTGEHPALAAIELINEPRGKGLSRDGKELQAWVDEVAKQVRTHAPRLPVLVGEEGWDDADALSKPLRALTRSMHRPRTGARFTLQAQSPWTDYTSVHFYPEAWGAFGTRAALFGALWMRDHAAISHRAGKGLIVGEFGLPSRDGDGLPAGTSLEERRRTYAYWLDCAADMGVHGVAPWMFANDERPKRWDRYSFGWKDNTPLDDPENEYADIIADHAGRQRVTP